MSFPPRYVSNTRICRMRKDGFSCRLMCKHTLTADDLIYPAFVSEGQNQEEAVPSMPDVKCRSLDKLLLTTEEALKLGIPMLALFPMITQNKTEFAEEVYNPEDLVPTVMRALHEKFPELGIMTDVALDPYTIHGQNGLTDENSYVLSDETIEVLVKQTLYHADAGAQVVAPPDVMDGRILVIREALEDARYIHTRIMVYSAKHVSVFYGPFRDAVGSSGNPGKADKKTYQISPANTNEVLREVALGIQEGADMVMVKSSLPYLDVARRVKDEFGALTYAYQVSDEYAMLQATIQNDWLDGEKTILESLLVFKRVGADGTLAYYTIEAAKLLKKQSKGINQKAVNSVYPAVPFFRIT